MLTETAPKKGSVKVTAENNKKASAGKEENVVEVGNDEIIDLPDEQLKTEDVSQSSEVAVAEYIETNHAKKKISSTKGKAQNKTTKPATKKVKASKEVAVNDRSSSKKEKPVQSKETKPATKKVDVSKKASVKEKKVRLASSCYHYYRHFLKDFLRPLVPSSRFQKVEDSYDGHILVAESEKAKGLKALEKWNKENPDVKELFWDVKK